MRNQACDTTSGAGAAGAVRRYKCHATSLPFPRQLPTEGNPIEGEEKALGQIGGHVARPRRHRHRRWRPPTPRRLLVARPFGAAVGGWPAPRRQRCLVARPCDRRRLRRCPQMPRLLARFDSDDKTHSAHTFPGHFWVGYTVAHEGPPATADACREATPPPPPPLATPPRDTLSELPAGRPPVWRGGQWVARSPSSALSRGPALGPAPIASTPADAAVAGSVR